MEEKTTETTKPAAATAEAASIDTTAGAEQAPSQGGSKKKKKKQVPKGRAYINATYNNTIVTFTDEAGNAIAQSSAGRCGFKGPKKSTPYAAGIIVRQAAEKARDMGLKDIDVYVKGVGSGRDGAIRALNAQGFNMMSIRDITPMKHGGTRAKKPRRV